MRHRDLSRQEAVAGLEPWLEEIYGDVVDRTRSGVFATVTDNGRAATARPPRAVADFVREHAATWRRDGAAA